MSRNQCSLLALSLASAVKGLTDLEMAAFQVGEMECFSDSTSTGGKELCPYLDVSSDGSTISITSNSVPSHGKHLKGYQYRDIFRGFCLEIVEVSGQALKVPVNPVKQATPQCVGQTAGIALDGVQLWNQYAPEDITETGLPVSSADIGVDAGKGMFAEPMDACSGHPGPRSAYHYHKLPAFGLGDEGICFAEVKPGQSTFLAVAADGFPIYSPYHETGEYTPDMLDECNGIEVNGQYRYIATADFPYGPGCLWGEVDSSWPSGLCWFADDWKNLVANTTYYADCDTTPVPESTGTEGCLSYKSNPELYKDAFGSIDGWCEKYNSDCGATDQWEIDCATARTTFV